MGAFAIPLLVAAAGFQAVSAYSSAEDAKSQAKAQSQIASNNAIIANNNADYQEKRAADALTRGSEAANAQRRKLAQLEGSQRAGFSGSGVLLDTGSPLDILNDTNMLGQEDVGNVLKSSQREAYGYRMGAYNYRATGNNNLAESSAYSAQASSINPFMSAASSAISSAGNIAGKWDSIGGGSSWFGSSGNAITSEGKIVGQAYPVDTVGAYGSGFQW